MKWSYKTVHFELKKEGLLGSSFLDETEIEEQLNQFGQAGWELVSVIEVQSGIICFFRQPLISAGMDYAERLEDANVNEDQHEKELGTGSSDERFETYEDDGVIGDDETTRDDDLIEQDSFNNRDELPEVEEPDDAEIDEYEVYKDVDYDTADLIHSDSYNDETQTVDDVIENEDETDNDPTEKGIGAIRIE